MDENNYDDLRKKNIAERNAIFAEFFKDIKTQSNEINELGRKLKDTENSENEPPRKRRKTIAGPVDNRVGIKHVQLRVRKKYNTRSVTKNRTKDDSAISLYEEKEEQEDFTESKGSRPRLQVLFPWAKPFQRSIDLMKMGVCDVDQEKEEYVDNDSYDITKKRIYKVNKSPYDPNSIPSVDEITDEMLNNIAQKSSLKQYCKISGTSCHQCRQKTLDTKTVCRSGECIGIRGQFCGPCLKGRYGENAVEALQDPDWACPPCRGLCNCSICRTRSGLPPTGILAPIAQEEGYSSVMDYLQSTEIDDT